MLLFLNDVAGSEIVLILLFVLVFFGAKSIPGLARTMGKTIRQVKDASAELQSEIKKSGNEMKNDLNLEGLIKDTEESIQRPLDQYVDDLDNAVKYESPKKSHLTEVKTIPEKKEVSEPEIEIEEEGSKIETDMDGTNPESEN